MNPHPPEAAVGGTLLETLIVAITATVLLGLLAASLRSVGREHGRERRATRATLRLVHDLAQLRRDRRGERGPLWELSASRDRIRLGPLLRNGEAVTHRWIRGGSHWSWIREVARSGTHERERQLLHERLQILTPLATEPEIRSRPEISFGAGPGRRTQWVRVTAGAEGLPALSRDGWEWLLPPERTRHPCPVHERLGSWALVDSPPPGTEGVQGLADLADPFTLEMRVPAVGVVNVVLFLPQSHREAQGGADDTEEGR